MNAVSPSPVSEARPRLGQLARNEILRYARHPLFLLGVALMGVTMLGEPDGAMSSAGNVIAPAAGLGVFGLVVMASLTRSSDQLAESAGAPVLSERTRTLALAASMVVPLAAGLAWFAWAVWAFHRWPPPPNATFPGIGDAWMYAMLFALGVMPAIGGPALGLVIGRWLPRRGAAPVAAVLLVFETIMMQGLFESLRYIRVTAPWTYFEGPFGVPGDENRMLVLTGSPQWYVGYLLALTAIGILVALLHDREQKRDRLLGVLGAVAVIAIVCCILAMTMGVQDVIINPLPGPKL